MGQFVLVEPLATGGMGRLFLARQVGEAGFEKDVVVKLVTTDLESKASDQMFVEEACTLARLRHPNIVQIIDFDCHEGQYFLVMEHLPGVNVERLIRCVRAHRRDLTIAECVHIVTEVAKALQYIHDGGPNTPPLGIVHRDVNPPNVVCSPDGEVKLIDFGVALLPSRRGREANPVVGKVSSMSPEQAVGDPLDGRSDLFALGCLFYEVLTQERAFCSRRVSYHLRAVRRGDYFPVRALRPEVPEQLEMLINKLLMARPSDRPQSGAQLVHELELVSRNLCLVGGKRGLAEQIRCLFNSETALFGLTEGRARTAAVRDPSDPEQSVSTLVWEPPEPEDNTPAV